MPLPCQSGSSDWILLQHFEGKGGRAGGKVMDAHWTYPLVDGPRILAATQALA